LPSIAPAFTGSPNQSVTFLSGGGELAHWMERFAKAVPVHSMLHEPITCRLAHEYSIYGSGHRDCWWFDESRFRQFVFRPCRRRCHSKILRVI
jgi:hypothetical protein